MARSHLTRRHTPTVYRPIGSTRTRVCNGMVTDVGAIVYLALLLDRTLQPLSLPSQGGAFALGRQLV